MMAMLFLLVVVGFSAVTLLNMSNSDLQDTTAQNDGVTALFLAESGIERASQLFSSGTACGVALQQPATNFGRGSLGPTAAVPVIQFGAPPGIPPGSYPDSCRVEVQGRVGLTTRTIQADLQRGPALGDIAFLNPARGSSQNGNVNTLTWNHGIAPGPGVGSNRALIVGVAIRRTGTQAVVIGPLTTYNGLPMVSLGAVTDAVNGLRIEWLYAANPPIGGNPQVRVRLTAAARAVGVSMAFSGVDTLAPVDAVSLSCMGNYPLNPLCSVTPLTDKTRVVDMLAARLTTTAAPVAGQNLAWSFAAGTNVNGVRGAGSYRPVSTSPAGLVAMGWTLTPSAPPPGPFTNAWLQSALALRPVPLMHIVRWTEL